MPVTAERPRAACLYSVVVPMHNEEAYVEPLYAELADAMDRVAESYELIFVDDGSTDNTFALLTRLADGDSRVRVVRLKKNFGQTAALAAGFDQAAGEIIVAMDADLRSSPTEIPILLDKLAEGYDLVSGWRKDRRHEGMLRTLPSLVASRLLAKLSGVSLRDFGSTFKVYRREVVRGLRLYGEQHRFIPVLASWLGARITEVPVSDSPRKYGKSHYGLSRILRVPFDLMTIKFLRHYRTRPLHFFGPVGLLSLTVGAAIFLCLLGLQLFYGMPAFYQHAILTITGVLAWLGGLQLLSAGLVAELIVRHRFEAQEEPIYRIESVVQAATLARSAR